MTDLSMLKMVRELVSAIKTRVCGEKAPLWQDDYHTTFSRGVIADQCDYAIAAVAPIIARMEQNTGGDEERLKHLLRRAIGLLRGATFEDAENMITASVVIEEGLQAVGGNTKREG